MATARTTRGGRGSSGRRGSRASQASREGRDPRVDGLRGLALLSMFVAHCAPSPGPFRLFDLTEFLTAPLFALLIGIGAQLGDRGARALPATFVRAGIRAAVLVVLGLWLDGLGAQVDIVLVYLALPTLLAPVLARLPSVWLWGLGVVCWAATPVLASQFADRLTRAQTQHDDLGTWLWRVTFAGEHYRLTSLLVFVCCGILIRRLLASRPAQREAALFGAGLLGVAVIVMALKTSGRVAFAPYDGSHLEIFFDVALTCGVALIVLALVPAHWMPNALSVAGSMTLSVYALQILYLAWYVTRVAPGQTDDSWANVVVLCVGGLALPMLWRSLVVREPWTRGPLEGPVALVTAPLR